MSGNQNWFQNFPQSSWVISDNFRRYEYNLSWQKFTGSTHAHGDASHFSALLHPEDVNRWSQCLAAYKKNMDPFEVELRFRNHNDKFVSHIVKCNPLKDQNGVHVGYIAVAIDISKRKAVEEELLHTREELNASEKLLADSQSAGRIGSFTLDFITSKVEFTKEGLRIFDYLFDNTDTTYGELIRAIHTDDREQVIQKLRTALKNKDSFIETEFRVELRDGKIRWILMRGDFTYTSKGDAKLFVGICMDHTERIEAQHQLENEKAKAVQAGKMAILGEMSSGIAHEINNPLSIIHGSAYNLLLMAKKGEVSRELITSAAEKILSTSTRITKIIKGLRAFSRDGSKESFEAANLGKIISDTLDLCSARFENYSIDLRVLPFDNDIILECRPVQISQVLLNLLGNAYDAIEKLPERWIELSIEDRGNNIEISVTDSGAGIPKEVADKIMQPFYTTKEVGKGTGLGLSISAGIVKDHNGKLSLDRNSKNTKFILMLPKEQPKIQEEAA